MTHTHYLLTPQHLPGVTWVALRTPSREGLVGGVFKRAGRWRTCTAGTDIGFDSGPHRSKDAAIKVLIDKALEKEGAHGKAKESRGTDVRVPRNRGVSPRVSARAGVKPGRGPRKGRGR